jgi:hypothetical protein
VGIVIVVVEGEEEEAMRVRAGWRRAANEKGRQRRPHRRGGSKRERMLLDLDVGEKATTAVATKRRRRKAALRPSPGIHCPGLPVVF